MWVWTEAKFRVIISKFDFLKLDRPGLGLGRSELQNPRESAETAKLVAAYKTYIKTSAKLLNSANVSTLQIAKDINNMLRFEQRLAKGSSLTEDRRDHFGLYNKMTIKQLQQRYPGVSLDLRPFEVLTS